MAGRRASKSVVDHLLKAGDAEKYPNPGLTAAQESYLPSHALFRPDMEAPRASYSLPKQKKKSTKPQAVEKINAMTEEIIEYLSSKEKFLPSDVIRNVVLDLIRKERNQTGILVQWREIDALSRFSKLHGRMEELIRVYCMFTPVTSIHELGTALAQSEKVANYEDLHLGPLIKHPKVKDFFKPPDDLDSPPEISVYQLHNHLTRMVDRSKRGEKFNIEDYLEFVRKKHGVETVEHLCVRIQSFPLLIQVDFNNQFFVFFCA